MISQIHLLLTYTCNYECDHCFLYCSPRASGTLTTAQIKRVLEEAETLGTVEWIYFEGGEPFLYFPILVEGLRLARTMGFRTGVVTNCYWATTGDDAALWIEPLLAKELADLSLSDDSFHHGEEGESPAKVAAESAASLGASPTTISIERPTLQAPTDAKGAPVVGGGALFRGRAVEKLTDGLPTRPASHFVECVHEELVRPKRVHVDCFGNVQVCQGVSIGNLWEKPLAEIIGEYDAPAHPICGPLSGGGPAELARVHDIEPGGEYVDECHYCFVVRRKLVDRFPEYLAPRQVYDLPTS